MGTSHSSSNVFSDVSLFRSFNEGLVAAPPPGPHTSPQVDYCDNPENFNDDPRAHSAAFRWDIIKRLTHNPVDFVNKFYWYAKLNVAALLSVLPVDDACRCKFAHRRGYDADADHSCTLVRPLGPKGVAGVPYVARCTTTGDSFVVKESRTLDTPTMFITRGSSVLKKMSVGYTKMLALGCSPELPHYVISSPEYVNETLIGYALEYIMNPPVGHSLQYAVLDPVPFRSHCYVQQFDAFVCNNKAFNVMELAGLGDLSEFVVKYGAGAASEAAAHSQFGVTPPEVLLNVCQQLVGSLCYLQKWHGFSHSDLKVKNVFCKRLATDRVEHVLEFGDVRIANLGFACALADYGKCSISLKSDAGHRFVRLHTEHRSAKMLLRTLFKFHPELTMDPKTNRASFRFNDSTHLLTLRLFFMGIGTYVSLDTYAVIASLMGVDPRVTQVMGDHPVIRRMLRVMWPNEDVVARALRGFRKTPDPKKRLGIHYAYNFLKRTDMQCDATERAWLAVSRAAGSPSPPLTA